MTRNRIIATAVLVTVLASLLVWQHRRDRQVSACLEENGVWDGRSCRLDGRRIQIQRALQRT
jgi:hypothetical protein